MTKEFLLKTLLPYKNNRELCGYNGLNCLYLTDDKKKCAIGQYMKEGHWQHTQVGVSALFEKYTEKEIMSDEWVNQNIPLEVAVAMQGYHDSIAQNNIISKFYIDKLVYHTGFDLKELC